jgi:plastocyanin
MPGLRASRTALPLAALALLGACGHTETLGNARTLYVALSEYRLAPQSVRVSAGPVTVFVHNYGRLTHNLVISRSSQATGATRPIWPGQSAEITLTLTPGTYLMASTIQSDEALGEYGTLKVTS